MGILRNPGIKLLKVGIPKLRTVVNLGDTDSDTQAMLQASGHQCVLGLSKSSSHTSDSTQTTAIQQCNES